MVSQIICREHGRLSGMEDSRGIQAMTAQPWDGPAIMLVDLDAFFASVEQLDHPAWRGKPVIVGGSARKRGVVSTASYEARTYGVRSAMASAMAERLCPDAIWTEGHFGRYREMSEAVMNVLRAETPHVQQVSIDEAFLDVTPTAVNREHPVAIARRIQENVAKLGVTCSIGLGSTKSIAKLASDMDKPRGLTVVFPGSEANFIDAQPVRALSGIGKAAESKLREMGITTLGELARANSDEIERVFGKVGTVMLERARGEEHAEVAQDDEVKSVSNEISFSEDFTDREDIVAAIAIMAAKVARRLRRKNLKGRTLALKVRYADLSVRSCQRPLSQPCDDEYEFMAYLPEMLDSLWERGMALRLVGVAVTGFDEPDAPLQLSLFDDDTANEAHEERRRDLLDAADRVKERFGESALVLGRELRLRDRNTGSSSKNPADYK